VDDIQGESEAVLDSIEENNVHGAFKAWRKQWDRCIHSQGDYVEGDGSQHFFYDLVRKLSDKPPIFYF
jgi:hypothetical protein